MKRLIAHVSGQVQKVGYRKRVMEIAKAFGLKGMVENLEDGRVKIIAEGEDEKLTWFESAIDIQNTLIQVSYIEKAYFPAGGEFSRFGKVVDGGETDSRLDKGVEVMNKMLVAIIDVNKSLVEMNSNLGGKIDSIGSKIDRIDRKMDGKLQKQDDLLVEVKDMNASLNDKMGRILDKTDVVELKSDMSDVKAALRAKGII